MIYIFLHTILEVMESPSATHNGVCGGAGIDFTAKLIFPPSTSHETR